MGHSSVVCLLVSVLFLFACVSVSATGTSEGQTDNTAQKEKKAVKDAQKSSNEICANAKSYISITKDLLKKVDPFKKEADELKLQATLALSQAGNAVQDSEEATAAVEDAKRFLNTVITLHDNVTKEVKTTKESMEQLLNQAESLTNECDKEIPIITGSEVQHEEATRRAANLKTKGDKLNKDMEAVVALINGVDSTAENMLQNLTKAQLKNLHVSAILAFTNIKTTIGDIDSITLQTQNKKEEVNGIVEEISKHCTPQLTNSNTIIKEQCESATNELTKATGALENATKAIAAMKQQKDIADAALTNVKTAIKVTNAHQGVKTAKRCVAQVQQIVLQLQSALQTASRSVTNAKVLKQKLMPVLPPTTGEPGADKVKETKKSNPPVADGTGPHQKDTTIQPTSTDSPNPSNTTVDQLNGTLIKGAHSVPTTALTGGKAPAPGAKNDSAMTVSVPLLVALIASAVLQ